MKVDSANVEKNIRHKQQTNIRIDTTKQLLNKEDVEANIFAKLIFLLIYISAKWVLQKISRC